MSRTIGRFVLATLLLAGFAMINILVGYTNGVNGYGHFDWDTFWKSFGIFTSFVPFVVVIVVLAIAVGLTIVLIRASHAIAIVAVWLALLVGAVVGATILSHYGWDWLNQIWPVAVLLLISGLATFFVDLLGPFRLVHNKKGSEGSPKTANNETETIENES